MLLYRFEKVPSLGGHKSFLLADTDGTPLLSYGDVYASDHFLLQSPDSDLIIYFWVYVPVRSIYI